MLKLSVVIPVYNKQAHLEKCLNSLIKQSYPCLEIICVNDGSSDNSLQILEKIARRDKRIRVFSQPNSGVSAARNTGVKAASGDYITFVDCDDYLDLEAYAQLMPLFKIYKDLDLAAFSAEVLLGEAGAFKVKSDDSYYLTQHSGLVSLSPDILFKENLSVCTKIFNLKLIKNKQIFFAEGFYYEDFEFCWKYMLHAEKAYFLKNRFYKYIRYRISIMAQTFRGSDKAIDHLYLTERLFAYFIETGSGDIFRQAAEKLLTDNFWLAYRYSIAAKRKAVLALAKKIAADYSLDKLYPRSKFISNLIQDKMHKYKNIDKCSFMQNIFSFKKLYYMRYLRILGVKFSFKRKSYKQLLENKLKI